MPELITPTDELTGLPLPIVPVESPVNPDWHHHFHPSKSLILQTPGGSALRQARLQRVDYDTHHFGYHNIYAGPPIPKDRAGQFALVIMSVAGYMPKQGLDFRGEQSRIVNLSVEQRQYLQRTGEVKFTSVATMRSFIRHYILSQSIDSVNVNELTVEEFLTTQDAERRRLLGHTLLALITDKATEPVNEIYYQAHKQNALLPGLPNKARRFTKAFLGSMRAREKLVTSLYQRLADA